jgi:anti-sigma B factor antagonist
VKAREAREPDEGGDMYVLNRSDGSEVTLSGTLDVTSVADVRAALHAAIDAGQGALVVDLADVDVTDATGLGVLVGAHRRAGRAGRSLVLRRVPPKLARLLAATRLNRVLRVETYLPVAAGQLIG